MKKKVITLLLASVMAVSLMACGGRANSTEETPAASEEETPKENVPEEKEEAKADEKKVFGATFMSLQNEHFQTITRGLQDWCDEHEGYELVALDPDYDASVQMQQLEDFIEMGIDGLFISCVDGESIVPALEKVMDAGIPVICVDDHPANEDDVDGLVSANNYMAGYQAGKALAEAINGEGEVAHIAYYIKNSTVVERDNGYYDALAEYPDIEIVDIQVAEGSTDTALPVAEDILTGYPDLKGFICVNDPTAQGAYSACEASGRTDVKIVGVDGSQSAMKLIQQGKVVATASQRPYDMGKTAADQMEKILNGEEIEHYIQIDTVLIDASNVEEYIED